MKKYIGLLFLSLLFSVCSGKKKKIIRITRNGKKHISLARKKRVESISQKLNVPFHVEIRNSRSHHPRLIESFKIINKNKIVVKADKSFSQKFLKEDFFAEYDASINLATLDESIVTIPFLLSVIPIVWLFNKTYSIDVMDKDLYHSLQKIREVFRIFYPRHSWSGELIPKKLVTNTMSPSNEPDQPVLALLFSNGLDSTSASISHIDIKQLLITAWGADVKTGATKQWNRVLEQCRKFSQIYGHDHTFIKSNFREFTETPYLYKKLPRWWVLVSHALAFSGLVAPLLMEHNIPALLVASTFTVKRPYPFGSHPAIDNNIAFAGSSVYHADADKDRVQKIANITNVCGEKNIPFPKLRVCCVSLKGENCLKCEKCFRTLTQIIIAGQEPKECGFNISVDGTIQRIKKFFQNEKGLNPNLLFLWRANIVYLRSLEREIKTSPIIFSYKRLSTIQALLNAIKPKLHKRYRIHNYLPYQPRRRKLFEDLWKKNIKKY